MKSSEEDLRSATYDISCERDMLAGRAPFSKGKTLLVNKTTRLAGRYKSAHCAILHCWWWWVRAALGTTVPRACPSFQYYAITITITITITVYSGIVKIIICRTAHLHHLTNAILEYCSLFYRSALSRSAIRAPLVAVSWDLKDL